MNSTLIKYLNSKRYDAFIYNRRKILRGETKLYVMKNKELFEALKSSQINYPEELVLDNPFELLNITELTDIQKAVIKNTSGFKLFGTFAWSCSCGSGKTLAAIYLIHYFKVKTLIVSARSAINNQWRDLLLTLYPNITIKTIQGIYKNGKKLRNNKKDKIEIDIYIYSPQYLMKDIENFPSECNFIIYDEIHSLLSTEFSKALMYNFELIITNKRDKLPYMICLSATYPKNDTKEYEIITKIFGKPYVINSNVTDIPVNIWDSRNNFQRIVKKSKKMITLDNEESLGSFDKKYIPLNDYEFIDYMCYLIYKIENNDSKTDNLDNDSKTDNLDNDSKTDNLETNENNDLINSIKNNISGYKKNFNVEKLKEELKLLSPLINTEFKGFVITGTIDSSVYAWLMFHKIFKCGCLLIRDITDKSYYLSKDDKPYEDINNMIMFDNVKNFGTKIDNENDVMNNVSMIFGTYHRLKEGISIENATWGLCSKFIYSTISRTQILGRIRRTSKDESVNNRKRLMIVNSMQVQTDEMKQLIMKRKGSKKDKIDINLLYDFDYEKEIFINENYKYI